MESATYEEYLKQVILPMKDHGRPMWDYPHTMCVVYYVKEIIKHNPQLHLDHDVLVIVGYLHDIGYMSFTEQQLGRGPQGDSRPKKEHAQKSAEIWDSVQDNSIFDSLGESRKNRIKHLILQHDELESLNDVDELVFMEADTLGALGTPSNVNVLSVAYQNYLRVTEKKRISRFITGYSTEESARLLKVLRKED